MWLLLAPSTSCALIRTRPPALRTLPSTTWVTLSSRATLGMSTCLSLYMNAVLLEITASAETLLRSVMMSSVMPSLKYSCSESPLMLANGSTQTEKRFDSLAEGDDAAEVLPACPDCAAVDRAIIAAKAFRHSCRTGWA